MGVGSRDTDGGLHPTIKPWEREGEPSAKVSVAPGGRACLCCVRMSEIANFVMHGAAQVTPVTLERMLRNLPMWKVEFAQINAPQFPHLVNQLEFLADIVEDVAEGAYKELTYHALAAAVFALTYAHRKNDLIPDFMGAAGRADDSSVVRAALILHEKAFTHYAEKHNINWEEITSKP